MEDTPQGLFKMKGFTDRTASGAKKDSTTAITPEGAANLDFNEYNCVGASSAKDGNESTFDRQQAHDQLSAQLQANRYLCKFHLQLCAIMSQLGQHVQANENGQKAAAIAEIILIKTHEFCQMSIDELMARDAGNVPNSKVKSSIIDHTVTDTQGNDSRDDYQGGNASLKSSMMKQNRVRKMTRGNSVTSLYSQEKERKSVSIRRSRSKTNSMQGRASSMAGNSDDTTQSLERMYTFNLSHMQKQVNAKNKGAKKETPAGVPAGEDAIDIRPVDMKNKNEGEGDGAEEGKNNASGDSSTAAATERNGTTLPILGISKVSSENPEEETKGRQTERTRSQASRSMPQTQTNFCPTYQVLERTNIQEKQIINVQPLLDEFRHVSEEFKQKDLTLDEAETHNKLAQFTSVREIQALKSNKRYKINVRNTLGVKDHNNWIYNLNIGNVMNLTPMNSDELNTQSDVFQELSKDTMLEKFILYVVAYFCVGTEIRFQATKMEKKESPQEYIKVWSSEMWHGKSLQVACIFLPEDCPLVDHIIKSYKKHYIGKSSLLSVVVQPKPRGRPNVPLQSSRSQPMQAEQKPPSMMNMERPSSQQQLSPPLAELQAEKLRLFQKSPNGGANRDINNNNATNGAATNVTNNNPANANTKGNAAINKDQSQNQNLQAPHHQASAPNTNLLHAATNSANPTGGSAPTATENNMGAPVGGNPNYAGQQPQKSGSAQSKRKTPVMIGGFQKQIGGIAQQKNSKQRQMTLKDMVFQYASGTSGNADQAQANAPNGTNNNPNAVTMAQSHKIPVKSPETPSGSEPEDENQEAVVIFKGLRKFSRNKPGTADSQEDGENGTGGQDSKEDQNNSVETGKASEPQQSPVVRRRAVLPAGQQQQPQQQEHQQVNDQTTKKSRQNAQTISYNDLARLQQNLNNQIQHNKQIASIRAQKSQEPGLPEPDTKQQILALGERPQSAQQISSVEGASSAGAQQISQGSSQKHVENLTNNISSGTPKRSGQVSHSHKRYHQGPSITASLTKVLAKPGAKGQSKVLQSEVLLNPQAQAWPTMANSASSKPQNKQKVIMLNKQKQKIINQPGAGGAHGQTALWLANNPASDKLQSKHPIQIGTTKFVDNQLKMLSENSNQNTARGAKKHSMGLQDAASSGKKESGAGGALIESLRKKPISDLHRAYDSNNLHSVAVAAQTAGAGNLTLSKSITKEKFHHQLPSHQGAANSILTASGPSAPQRSTQMHHPLSNKLAGGPGHHQTHTLKKSASTRQVVNLLDLKQIQQTHIYGGSSKQGLLAKHVGGIHHQIGGGGGKQAVGSSVKSGAAAGQVQSQSSAAAQAVGASGQSSNQVQPGFKTLSKKHKNAKSTGLLHHHM